MMGPVQMPLQAIQPAWKHQAEEGKVNIYRCEKRGVYGPVSKH